LLETYQQEKKGQFTNCPFFLRKVCSTRDVPPERLYWDNPTFGHDIIDFSVLSKF